MAVILSIIFSICLTGTFETKKTKDPWQTADMWIQSSTYNSNRLAYVRFQVQRTTAKDGLRWILRT